MKPIVSGKGLMLRLHKAVIQVRANERLAGKLKGKIWLCDIHRGL